MYTFPKYFRKHKILTFFLLCIVLLAFGAIVKLKKKTVFKGVSKICDNIYAVPVTLSTFVTLLDFIFFVFVFFMVGLVVEM